MKHLFLLLALFVAGCGLPLPEERGPCHTIVFKTYHICGIDIYQTVDGDVIDSNTVLYDIDNKQTIESNTCMILTPGNYGVFKTGCSFAIH